MAPLRKSKCKKKGIRAKYKVGDKAILAHKVPSPVSDPVDPSPVSDPVDPSTVSNPVEPSPVSDPAEPSPVSDPVGASQASDPVGASQVSDPVESSKVSDTVDPLLMLGDTIIANIFSFFGASETSIDANKDLLNAPFENDLEKELDSRYLTREAFRFYGTLRLVCKDLARVLSKNTSRVPRLVNMNSILGLINLNMNKCLYATLMWIRDEKMLLGHVTFSLSPRDVNKVSDLLRDCDTTQLRSLTIETSFYDNRDNRETTINLFNLIRNECPKLEAVSLQLHRTTDPDFYQPLHDFLTSLTSLRVLNLNFVHLTDGKIVNDRVRDGIRFASSTIGKLNQLERLDVYADRCPFILTFESSSLRFLNTAGNVMVPVEAPKLEEFSASFVHVLLTAEQFRNVRSLLKGDDLVVSAEARPMIWLAVPPTCKCKEKISASSGEERVSKSMKRKLK